MTGKREKMHLQAIPVVSLHFGSRMCIFKSEGACTQTYIFDPPGFYRYLGLKPA